jgi:hypothetical protein
MKSIQREENLKNSVCAIFAHTVERRLINNADK